jgi:hypothetical protein
MPDVGAIGRARLDERLLRGGKRSRELRTRAQRGQRTPGRHGCGDFRRAQLTYKGPPDYSTASQGSTERPRPPTGARTRPYCLTNNFT